jgi:RNA polymerase sigma factor for flagellar operon FliA
VSAALKQEERAARVLSTDDYRRFLPLVRRTAMRVGRNVPSHVSVADLIGYAWVGLVEATRRRGSEMTDEEFEAYALYRIRGAMLDHLRDLDPQTRACRAASRRVTQAIAALTRRLGRAPEEDEIAAELGVAVEEYRATLTALDRAGMNRLELLDVDREVPPDTSALPESLAARQELLELVVAGIEALPERLRNVLTLYYEEECTLREVGAVLDVSEARACQLHTEAIHRLRAAIGRE